MSAANTGTYICEPFGTAPDSHTIVTFGAQPGAGPGEQTLTTGVVPAISSDGHWLAYNRREVAFPEGYGAPDAHEEDETYCPNVERDVAELCRLPVAGVPDLIETDDDSSCGSAYGAQNIRLGVARDANHVVFVSRTNKLCYATLVPD